MGRLIVLTPTRLPPFEVPAAFNACYALILWIQVCGVGVGGVGGEWGIALHPAAAPQAVAVYALTHLCTLSLCIAFKEELTRLWLA